jgi:serine/threonine-protein kinase
MDRAVRAIAEGEAIDAGAWTGDDPSLRELKVLYEIARIHRAVADPDPDPAATVGTPPPVSVGAPTGRWAHFHLLATIGTGVSSTVYRAWDSRLAREVALKLMVADRTDVKTRLAEAQRLARVKHPHVVSVLGVEHRDGCVGMWMELLKGRTLHDLVRDQGPFNAAEAALIASDVASALAAVHRAGLLHRDVKAQNVFREYGGRIVLLDLGAGRERDRDAADLAGTPLYMAPEVITGGTATSASDIYGLGVLLFYLTTGETPIVAATLDELKQAHARGAVRAIGDVRPDLPRRFVDLVDRALAPEPRRRFSSAGDMARALAAQVSAPSQTDAVRGPIARLLSGGLPLWAVAVLVASAVAASVLITRVVSAPTAGGSPSTPAAPANPMRIPSPDQLSIARAFEELASTLGSQGRWAEAVANYEEAERVYRINTSPDAPLVARSILHTAWAQHQVGDLEKAVTNYELAVAKYRDFDIQPMMSAALTALAMAEQSAGRFVESARAIDGALEARAQALGLAGAGTGLGRIGLAAPDMVAHLAMYAVGADHDRDWLPDLLEAVTGLNPRARDTNGNGRPDGDDDHDGDGLSNALEFGVPIDPTGVIAHYRGNNPEWLGFVQPAHRRIEGQAVEGPAGRAWRMSSFGQSNYSFRLTTAQRAAALRRGWRMTTSGRLIAGKAYVCVDLTPGGPRYDLGFVEAPGGGIDASLHTSVVPLDGIVERLSSARDWIIAELEYDPLTKRAGLIVNGQGRAIAPYLGHRQFQEALGFWFGLQQVGDDPASADFSLAMLTIR